MVAFGQAENGAVPVADERQGGDPDAAMTWMGRPWSFGFAEMVEDSQISAIAPGWVRVVGASLASYRSEVLSRPRSLIPANATRIDVSTRVGLAPPLA